MLCCGDDVIVFRIAICLLENVTQWKERKTGSREASD